MKICLIVCIAHIRVRHIGAYHQGLDSGDGRLLQLEPGVKSSRITPILAEASKLLFCTHIQHGGTYTED
jgi:hypothetical protein